MARVQYGGIMSTHFVVSRLNWNPGGTPRIFVRLPGETRVAAFTHAEDAEADCVRREAEARVKVNPFHCGFLWADICHLPVPLFCDYLRDGGIEPPMADSNMRRRFGVPDPQPPTWADWWNETSPTLTAAQVAHVWAGLSRLRFFRVEERPVRQMGYAIVAIHWDYNDEWYYPSVEGGRVETIYRSRERAMAICAERNAQAREQWRDNLGLPESVEEEDEEDAEDEDEEDEEGGLPAYELYPFDMETRLFPGRDPFDPPVTAPKRGDDDEPGEFAVDEVPFYEVIEVELPEEYR